METPTRNLFRIINLFGYEICYICKVVKELVSDINFARAIILEAFLIRYAIEVITEPKYGVVDSKEGFSNPQV
mgnify:CR=1 FL=1